MTEEQVSVPTGVVAAPSSAFGRARLVLETMRPLQWTKNAFVLGGLVFSGNVLDGHALLRTFATFAAFCLASGAAYLLNDVSDAATDRANPRTASRPIARGDLAPRTALVAAVISALAAFALVAPLGWQTPAVLAGFVALQIAYSMKLKHIVLLDAMAIAALFVLRALAGLVAIPVAISEWLLLCTFLLALFLGFAKRRGEVLALGGDDRPTRPVLDDYSLELLDHLLLVVAPTTVMAYSVYSVTAASTSAMVITVPFVLYGVFRYLFLIHKRYYGERPETAALTDRGLGICIVLWGVTAAIVSYIAA